MRPRTQIDIAWEFGRKEGIEKVMNFLTEYEVKHGQEARLQEALEEWGKENEKMAKQD